MKRMAWFLPVLLLVACTRSPRSDGSREDVVLPSGTPLAEEICLKPEDTSGITVELYKYAAQGTFQVKPGWTVAFRSSTIPASISFPRAVDRNTVKLNVVPSSWVLQPTNDASSDQQFTFRLLPGGNLTTQESEPGWIVVTVQQALDKNGQLLIKKPFSISVFVYDEKTARDHPYLKECQSTLVIQTTSP